MDILELGSVVTSKSGYNIRVEEIKPTLIIGTVLRDEIHFLTNNKVILRKCNIKTVYGYGN